MRCAISRKTTFVCVSVTVIIALLLYAAYAFFSMPLQFNSSRWENPSLRPRVIESVGQIVIGLTADEIVDLLGRPPYNTAGIFHSEGRGLVYVINSNVGFTGFRNDFLVIILGENSIAVETRTERR